MATDGTDPLDLRRRALELHAQGNLAEAQPLYQQVLTLIPDDPIAAQALSYCIAHYNPPTSDWNGLAASLIAQSRFAEAESTARGIIARDPNDADGHLNLAAALHEQNQIELSIEQYLNALKLKPNWALAYSNLGGAYNRAAQMDEAESAGRKSVELEPNSAPYLSNLATILIRRGKLDEAVDILTRALSIDANNPRAHFNLGVALLAKGHYTQAWPHHEWRPNARAVSGPKRRLWQGENLTGQSIVLRAEQGIGDTIMFIRYAPSLRDRGATRIIVECAPDLIDLLATATGVDEVHPYPTPPPSDTHFEVPMMSLPHRFNTTPEAIPSRVPYLRVDPNRAGRLRSLVGHDRRFKVGLIWSGNPMQGNNHQRSIRLELLTPITAIDRTALYSLQKGEPANRDRAITDKLKITDLGSHLSTVADLAAAMSLLDLIITVDTGPAHLAGALGLPVWTMLSNICDWRWMRDRTDTPWYPSMRLFRQPKPFDWETVVAEVVTALADRLQSQPT